MRIYDGSPRQDWEEVLRAIGAFADRERLKDLLFLELEGGFVFQGLAMASGGSDSDSFGALAKRTYELTEDQVAELMEAAEAKRGSADSDVPHPDLLTRAWVLGPLAELAPGLVHPVAGETIATLWSRFDRRAHPLTPVALEAQEA